MNVCGQAVCQPRLIRNRHAGRRHVAPADDGCGMLSGSCPWAPSVPLATDALMRTGQIRICA
jgi:hypothetical protein